LNELGKYLAVLGMLPKVFMAYQLWFWIGLVLNVIGMTVMVFFWRGVYGQSADIAGLTITQTITYILLVQVFSPLADMDLIFDFGYNMREGAIIHQLLRPISFQGMYYAQNMGSLLTRLILQLPIALVATLAFGLRWPSDPAAWGAFAVSAVLGYTTLFFFHWCIACLTFYTTEVWGLGVLIFGMSLFLSGGLVPVVMMPEWLRTLVLAIPFAQSVAVPINLLTGITPLADVWRVWGSQLLWLAGMWAVSNLIFRLSVRKVTVQGG
jgi:ABC-2 type transport system permease protein